MLTRFLAKILTIGLVVGVTLAVNVAPAQATSMPFHEYNLCGNRCVNTTHQYTLYQAADRVVSEVQDGSTAFAVILEEVCSLQATRMNNSLAPLGFVMTTRYTLSGLTNCGSYGNVIFTRGTRTGVNNFLGYYTFSNPDAQDGEARRMVCVSANAYIVFAVCGTHLATNTATSESPKDYQLDQFLYLGTGSYALGKVIGGDFNDTPDESHLDGYYNGYYEADQSNRISPQNTIGGSNPSKIDYMFADNAHFLTTRSLVVLTSNPASDHYYLKAYFNV